MRHVITLSVQGGCGLITLFSPPVNALGQRVRSELMAALKAAQVNERVAWILIQAGGRCFSAGADMKELGQPFEPPFLPEVVEVIEASPKPCVAWLHGVTLGGGLELAMACHYRIAAPEARFGLPEVRLGMIPGVGGTQRLPRLVGLEGALEMIITGEPVAAARACEIGLIDLVAKGYPPEDKRLRMAEALARQGVRRTRDLPLQSVTASPMKWLSRRRGALPAGEKAPFKVIEALEMALTAPFEAAVARERELFLECLVSPQRQAKTRNKTFLAQGYGTRARSRRAIEETRNRVTTSNSA